jgi:TM2 domain-containing membrane protein YozV
MPPPQWSPPAIYAQPVMVVTPPKSRVAYVLLGLFLGGLGIHNFYAGRTGHAVAQLLIVVLGWWLLFIPVLIVWVWVLIEVITVTRDGQGVPFA